MQRKRRWLWLLFTIRFLMRCIMLSLAKVHSSMIAKLSVSDAQNLSSSILCSEWGSQRDATMDTKCATCTKAVLALSGHSIHRSAALPAAWCAARGSGWSHTSSTAFTAGMWQLASSSCERLAACPPRQTVAHST
uniref:Secreted protein n=1 Tax=Macrostomum lignano TaxID=282301 RepID=A0A1I8FT53_9PLAT